VSMPRIERTVYTVRQPYIITEDVCGPPGYIRSTDQFYPPVATSANRTVAEQICRHLNKKRGHKDSYEVVEEHHSVYKTFNDFLNDR
jgi:hypothetical protein